MRACRWCGCEFVARPGGNCDNCGGAGLREPTPATPAAPEGEAVLLKFVEFVASVTCEDMHCEATAGMAKRALADYRRLREGK